ncbi:hypothetical protein ASPFODRAFT_683964 [Aspergillus luchuensis CBS 106.47]|uniref:Uncharacterized protein n=1 Tax=Aspergillus luchuensis (strain CBS 106.47) TaxID=1137211 RepID=A0A1M3TCS0_ASPLC|nr:hypothetical protein ASPFODRAFT_683964 [Aspergillus luchuensis CBS 106.47]
MPERIFRAFFLFFTPLNGETDEVYKFIAQRPFFSTDNTISFPLSACCEGSSFRAPVKNSILRLPIGTPGDTDQLSGGFEIPSISLHTLCSY